MTRERRRACVSLSPSVFAVLLAIWLPAFLVADDSTEAAFELYEAIVLENNLELASLIEQLSILRESYTQTFLLSESNISVSGGYSYAGGGEHDLSGAASLHIPVLPVVSVDIQATTSGNASLQISFTPLSALAGKAEIEEQMAILETAILYKRLQLRWDCRSLLLHHAAERKRLHVLSQMAESERLRYDETERQFDAGYISTGDLRSAADAYAIASSNRINAMQQTSDVERDLIVLAGTAELPREIFDFSYTPKQIESLIFEARERYEELFESAEYTSQNRMTMMIQKLYLEREIESTWPVEPGLTLSLSGSVSGVLETPTGSAGSNLSLTLGSASFHFDELRELWKQLNELDMALLLDRTLLAIEERNLEATLESATISTGIAFRSLENLADAVIQAERDLKQDEISPSEYHDIRFDRDLAEITYANTLITLYGILGTLIQSYEINVVTESNR